jgi:hypothetical protein
MQVLNENTAAAELVEVTEVPHLYLSGQGPYYHKFVHKFLLRLKPQIREIPYEGQSFSLMAPLGSAGYETLPNMGFLEIIVVQICLDEYAAFYHFRYSVTIRVNRPKKPFPEELVPDMKGRIFIQDVNYRSFYERAKRAEAFLGISLELPEPPRSVRQSWWEVIQKRVSRVVSGLKAPWRKRDSFDPKAEEVEALLAWSRSELAANASLLAQPLEMTNDNAAMTSTEGAPTCSVRQLQ